MTAAYPSGMETNLQELLNHYFGFSLQTLRRAGSRKKAAKRRLALEKRDIRVPSVMTISLPDGSGFGKRAGADHSDDLAGAEWRRVLQEAFELGVSVVMVRGEDPFMRPELLTLVRSFPEMHFLVYSEGNFITDPAAEWIRRLGNLVPVLTGASKYSKAGRSGAAKTPFERAIRTLRRNGLSFGVEADAVTPAATLRELRRRGCRLFIDSGYVPAGPRLSIGADGLIDSAPCPATLRKNVRELALEDALRETPAHPGQFPERPAA